MQETWLQYFGVTILGLVFFFILWNVQVDISTGSEKLIIATVVDKKHEVETHHIPRYDHNGNYTYDDTYTNEYYNLVFKRDDGIIHIIDLFSSQELNKYNIDFGSMIVKLSILHFS